MTFTTILTKQRLPNGRGRYSQCGDWRIKSYPIETTKETILNFINSDAAQKWADARKACETSFFEYCNGLVSSSKKIDCPLKHYGIKVESVIRKIAYVTILDCCRIPNRVGQQSKKLSIRQKGVIQYLIHTRNLDQWNLRDCKIVYFKDQREKLLCTWLLRELKFEESVALNTMLEDDYIQDPSYWCRGCEASIFPEGDPLLHNLKDEVIMQGTGMNDDTQTIISMGPPGGPKESGKTNYITYRNHETGLIIRIPFGMPVPRKVHYDTSVIDELCATEPIFHEAFNHLKQVYKDHCPEFFTSRGCEPEHLEEELSLTMEKLKVGVNRETTKAKIGIHCDIPVRSPALVVGRTSYVPDPATKSWTKVGKGGNLFLADGMISLDYHPQDIVLFDGNILHGITQMTGPRPQDLSRFSIVMFSRHNCSSKIPHYGNYNDSFEAIRKSKRLRRM